MARPAASATIYDWATELRADPRVEMMQKALDRILATSFPAIAGRLQKNDPPPLKQETATHASRLPVVKPEPRGPERMEVDVSAYLTESSSDVDSQTEIDPKEALREMEARIARGEPAEPEPAATTTTEKTTNGSRDVVMDGDAAGEIDGSGDEEDDVDEDEEPTACAVCHKNDNEKQILLCDGCDDEYHMYCLRPPLTAVPPGDWFCPKCIVTRAASGAEAPEAMDVDDEPLSKSVVRIKQEMQRSRSSSSSDTAEQEKTATSVSIAQTFENDVERSNELLIHACNCDSLRCTDAMFSEFCPLMKRFLRSACWASHNEKWLSYRIAKATAELLSYHSLHCQVTKCNVPLCDELRVEEYV